MADLQVGRWIPGANRVRLAACGGGVPLPQRVQRNPRSSAPRADSTHAPPSPGRAKENNDRRRVREAPRLGWEVVVTWALLLVVGCMGIEEVKSEGSFRAIDI